MRGKNSGYREKYVRYQLYHKVLIVVEWIIAVLLTVIVWCTTHNYYATLIVGAGMLAMAGLTALHNRIDDRYISGVIAELARLIDVLSELSEQDIFPENEDTLLSKLQNKVVKLAKMLRKKQETAEQDKENVKALVSDISHQLKTPIANLKMYTDLLQDESLTAERREEYTEALRLSVERLSFLSESMIKISRLESGLIHLHMERQSLNETAMQAVKAAYSRAKASGVEIRYENPEDKDIVIKHDRNWTSEAVFNLLDNGIKYVPDGENDHPVLTLRLRQLGSFAVVEVEDENGAIPEEEQTRVFTRFYRGKNSLRREGIGVGLYLTQEIAVRQGGYINLKTTEKGNIFSVYLYVE
ncbi:MAG: sensor histidine kinase [Wujia sp.]